jgi:glycerol-3-phosphate dehydrogenase
MPSDPAVPIDTVARPRVPPEPAAAEGTEPRFDVLVVGGGVNGAGIARDLAGRGARVLLVEQHDLASHTSGASTKLIHGGLRYLEYREFSLVRKALAEREVLLRAAPHIMWPLRFVMPHDAGLRPAWMIRAGLFLYDHLARREVLPGSAAVDLRQHPAGRVLHQRFTRGFAYSDGWVDDARLVVLNALDAAEHGAEVLTRTTCRHVERDASGWRASLQTQGAAAPRVVRARALVNAAGPWAAQFLREHAGRAGTASLRLVKGSHIVVRRLFDHPDAYLFQNPDGRVLFAIPYEGDFTLVGTTDVEHRGAIGEARIDAGEIAYLCEQASRYFRRPVTPADVVWSYSGVRPLIDDESGNPAAVTRDYRLELDAAGPPLLTVWGGKITTFRKLAEEAADRLAAPLGLARGAWTAGVPLPGGDLSAWIGAARRPDTDFERFVAAVQARHPGRPAALVRRWARLYGSRLERLLASPAGAEIAPGVFEVELAYLRDHEWARSADDVLWRRTKLGLHLDEPGRQAVRAWWQAQAGMIVASPTTVGVA